MPFKVNQLIRLQNSKGELEDGFIAELYYEYGEVRGFAVKFGEKRFIPFEVIDDKPYPIYKITDPATGKERTLTRQEIIERFIPELCKKH